MNPSIAGRWVAGRTPAAFEPAELVALAARPGEPLYVVRDAERLGVGIEGSVHPDADRTVGLPLAAVLGPVTPEALGDRSFLEAHALRYPYIAGEMANGIATTRLVIEMGRAGMLGFFGAAGLGPDRVEKALDELDRELGDRYSFGVNLIHSPNEPALEERVADLLVRRGVRRISASAYMALTPAIVRCSASGLRLDATGRIERRHHIFAKLSRPEVARHFLSPAPPPLLRGLVEQGLLTASEAELAARVPVAEDVTVEADSGGHTDNRPLTVLLPTVLALRDELVARFEYARPIRVGAAGGIGTPAAAAAAFAMGAAYVLTGSINQSAVESGLSDAGKEMLAKADMADVMMAPAADMFELGVKVQVLKRGTLFAPRAARLYEAYAAHGSLEEIPAPVRTKLERDVLHATFDEIWADTRAFWSKRDPREVEKADANPKHRMALVFRWYLGKASKWAIDGEPSRAADYQIWCGPAMGAFNAWAKGSFLEDWRNRRVVEIALNLLHGAAAVTRAQQMRTQGLSVPPAAFHVRPTRHT
jgi:trans-AT polyketide synthase/acyltransferase/oxidoreductase domain-containing protein